MREFFSSIRFKVFAVIALVLLGLMIRTAVSGGFSSYTQNAVGYVTAPLQKLSSAISGVFTGAVNGIIELKDVKGENAALKKQVDELQSRLVNYNEMQREYDQLSKAYDLLKENPGIRMAPASIISRDRTQWYSSFTIDRGSKDGVKPGDPVVTSEGLVGKVTQVSVSSSTVTSILDPSVSVGVLVSETGDPGLTQGDLTLMSDGEFKVAYLSKDSAVSTGNIIVTSGRGGVFPKNLKVAMVQTVKTESSGMSLYAVCRPIVNPSEVKSVFIITDFSGKSAASS